MTPAAPRRVAIVAIHGVADQALGATAQSIADLLLTQQPNGTVYGPAARSDVTIDVPPIAPMAPRVKTRETLRKRMAQSFASDFVRRGWQATGARRSLREREANLTRGAEFTEYLLTKADQNYVRPDTYTAPVLTLPRQRPGERAGEVDIWEMYWADLSRLSGSAPRILTELFTLVFRLSALGKETVQAAAAAFPPTAAWKTLAWTQSALDWLYSRVLALLFLQLVVLVLLIVPMALVAPHVGAAHWVAIVAVAVGTASWIAYRGRSRTTAWLAGLAAGWGLYVLFSDRLFPAMLAQHDDVARWAAAGAFGAALAWWIGRRGRNTVTGLLAGVALAVLLRVLPHSDAMLVGLAWLAMLCVVYDWWVRFCEERFRLVRLIGWLLWGATLALVAYGVLASPVVDAATWVTAALFAVEGVLLAIKAWWVAAAGLMIVWLVAGSLAARGARGGTDDASMYHADAARASVATGRVGLLVSLGMFVTLAMSMWALLTGGVELAVGGIGYCPSIFHYPVTGCVATESVQPIATMGTAAFFLDDRFTQSTAAFSLTAVLLLGIGGYLTRVFLPSVLAELELGVDSATRLGKWLTGGYRLIDRRVGVFATVSVLATAVTAIVLWAPQLGLTASEGVGSGLALLKDVSQKFLSPLVFTAATATVAFSAAGGLLSRYVPWIRAPLDAALDVDNHLREFPRTAIPRVRIFSRYVAILRELAGKYDEILIVSHSQGTVISTELLRYLGERAALEGAAPWPGSIGELWSRLRGRLSLVTAGCPLRQLYGARFPVLYDWVFAIRGGGVMGPTAADVGVNRWANLYATGDYVGRWIWTRRAGARDTSLAQIDELDGRPKYADSVVVTTSCQAMMPGATERDIGTGAGAHTHYFDKGQEKGRTKYRIRKYETQAKVARIVDVLLSG